MSVGESAFARVQIVHAPQNGRRGLAVELLKDDGPQQCLERALYFLRSVRERAGLLDDAGQRAVGPPQGRHRFLRIEWEFHRSLAKLSNVDPPLG